MSFAVDANNYLGQSYADHTSKILSLALSDPKKFYEARSNCTKILKRAIVKDFYDNLFSVLSKGETSTGQSVYGSTLNARDYNVDYPKQKINEIALSFVATIDKMLDEITGIILPDRIQRQVEDKLSNMGKASIL